MTETPGHLVSLTPVEDEARTEGGSFLQSPFWGRFKARFGWQALGFRAEWRSCGLPNQKTENVVLVLHRPLGFGVSFAYVPWGPELPPDYASSAAAGIRAEAAAELAGALRSRLPGDTAFIRFDFPWYTEEGSGTSGGIPRPFLRAAADVQPPDTVWVDLAAEEEAILGAMKPKWRYNVGLAEKKGVAIRRTGKEGLETFYALYGETAERDGIAIHGMEYYAALFDEAARNGGGEKIDLRLYLASHEGEDIAGIVTLFRGKEAVYLYGASSSRKRNLMAPYALQWRAIRDARAAGCRYYDLFGIPPRPPEEEPDHPMSGLYRFKTGFTGDPGPGDGKRPGGRIIHRPGSWDYPYRPLAAALYRAAEKTRKHIWDLKKKFKRRG